MADEALLGGLSAVIIYGEHRAAQDARAGWVAHAVRPSQAVKPKKLNYSVVAICASLLIPQYSACPSI